MLRRFLRVAFTKPEASPTAHVRCDGGHGGIIPFTPGYLELEPWLANKPLFAAPWSLGRADPLPTVRRANLSRRPGRCNLSVTFPRAPGRSVPAEVSAYTSRGDGLFGGAVCSPVSVLRGGQLSTDRSSELGGGGLYRRFNPRSGKVGSADPR